MYIGMVDQPYIRFHVESFTCSFSVDVPKEWTIYISKRRKHGN